MARSKTFIRITNEDIWNKLQAHDKNFEELKRMVEEACFTQKIIESAQKVDRIGLYALGTTLLVLAGWFVYHLMNS